MNYLEAQTRNRHKTTVLIIIFIALCTLGGAGIDATLMAGVGDVWFSIFGLIALAFLVPLWISKLTVRLLWSLRNPGSVDEFGYEEESSWVTLYLCLVPIVGMGLLLLLSKVVVTA